MTLTAQEELAAARVLDPSAPLSWAGPSVPDSVICFQWVKPFPPPGLGPRGSLCLKSSLCQSRALSLGSEGSAQNSCPAGSHSQWFTLFFACLFELTMPITTWCHSMCLFGYLFVYCPSPSLDCKLHRTGLLCTTVPLMWGLSIGCMCQWIHEWIREPTLIFGLNGVQAWTFLFHYFKQPFLLIVVAKHLKEANMSFSL